MESQGESAPPGIPSPAAGAPAWIAWRVERQRVLVALAAAGVGLLVTLLVAVGPVSGLELVLVMAGCGAFFVALLAGLLGSARGRPGAAEPSPARLEAVALVGVLAGVVFAILAGLAAGMSDLDQADEQDEPDSSGHYQTSSVVDAFGAVASQAHPKRMTLPPVEVAFTWEASCKKGLPFELRRGRSRTATNYPHRSRATSSEGGYFE